MPNIILLNLSPDLIKDKYVSYPIKKDVYTPFIDLISTLNTKFGVQVELYRVAPELRKLPKYGSFNGINDILYHLSEIATTQILGFKVVDFNITENVTVSVFDDLTNFINSYILRYGQFFEISIFNLALHNNKLDIIKFMLKLEDFNGIQMKQALSSVCDSENKYDYSYNLALKLVEMILNDPTERFYDVYIINEDHPKEDYPLDISEFDDEDIYNRAEIHWNIYVGAVKSGWWDIVFWASELPKDSYHEADNLNWWNIGFWNEMMRTYPRDIIQDIIDIIQNNDTELEIPYGIEFSYNNISSIRINTLYIAFRIGSQKLVDWVENVDNNLKLSNIDSETKNALLPLGIISNSLYLVQNLIDVGLDLKTYDSLD